MLLKQSHFNDTALIRACTADDDILGFPDQAFEQSTSLAKPAEAIYAEYRRQKASVSGGRGFRLQARINGLVSVVLPHATRQSRYGVEPIQEAPLPIWANFCQRALDLAIAEITKKTDLKTPVRLKRTDQNNSRAPTIFANLWNR
jgi:hypothetical protein